jgi:protein-tyrosine phosphatase
MNPLPRAYLYQQWHRFFGLNATAVTPLLYVGGQFRPDQWPDLYALGIRAVLSLQAEYIDEFSGPPPTAALRIAVADFHPPAVDQLDGAADFITAQHAAGRPVLVHCHAGVGRAPMTAAAFLMRRHAQSAAQALQTVRQARPIIRPNRRQLQRLDEYAAHLHRH